MATSRYTLTGTAGDLVGAPFTDPKTGFANNLKAWIETDLPAGEYLVDIASGGLQLGTIPVTLGTGNGGAFTVANLIGTNNVAPDVNWIGFHYRMVVEYTDLADPVRKTVRTPWFALTADLNIRSVVETSYAPPTATSELLAQMEALLAAQIDFSHIDDSDSEVAALISNGMLGPLTRAALSASMGDQLATAGTPARLAADARYALVGASLTQAPGKNLFDPNAATVDKLWNGTTAPVTLAGWYASPKIAFTSGSVTFTGARNVQTFKADGTFVRFLDNPSEAVMTVTWQATETHIAFSTSTAKATTVAQEETGASATSYEPYGVRVARLLGSGGYADVQLASLLTSTAALTSSQRLSGEIRVQKSGNSLNVRSRFDDTRDIVMPISLARTGFTPGNTMVMYATDAQTLTALVASTASDADVFPSYAAGVATTVHDAGDDNCPIFAGGSYVGGNHGWLAGSQVTMTAHGKTTADLGSQWTDGTRTYTLLRVIDANTLLFGNPYTIPSGTRVTPGTTGPSATLTHSSGASHTASVTISGGVSQQQIRTSTHSRTVAAFLDGRVMIDGAANGRILSIVETYQIVSYKGLIDWAQAHVGSDPFTNLPSMTNLGRVSNTYRFGTRATVIVGQTLTLVEDAQVSMTVTQATGLTLPASGSYKEFMPGVGTINVSGTDYDLRTEAALAASSGVLAVLTANYLNTGEPPNRSYQWAYTSAPAKAWGLMMGLLPVMDGTDARRVVNNVGAQAWAVVFSSKKQYPQLATSKTLTAGSSLSGVAYRRYLPPTATPEQVISDGSRYWVIVDRTDANASTQTAKVPEVLGRALTVKGTSTLTKAATFVTPEGISYTNPAPGVLLAEAVVDTTV